MTPDNRPADQSRTDRAGLVIAAIMAAFSIGMAWSTYNAGGTAAYAPVGPKTVPFIVAGGLFILSIWTAFEAFRGDFPKREPQNLSPMLWIIGGLAVQMLLIKSVGFSIATGLLFAATARGFGRDKFWFTIPVGIVFSFVIWFIFAKGLQLSLPAGPLERLF